ncbi:MAG: outer membrane protein transport protein [Bacteroidales bacterium]|nr:outer membrane protein transport protein [Bacteroidales bacterium]
MRKIIVSVIALLGVTLSVNAQMDNLANMSAKWIRSNVRNAALDGGADMVNFNPAGLSLLNDGIYVSLSNQTLFRNPEHTFNFGAGNTSYKQDGIDPFLPMFYAAYKKSNMAISSGVYISGGGATVNYPDGSFNTNLMGYKILLTNNVGGYTSFNDQSLEASSYYLTVPLHFSYAVNEKLALSVGGRYIRGINKTKAGMTLTGSAFAPDYEMNIDYKSNANGFGGIFGIDYKFSDKLNVAIHYETRVKLNFEVTDNSGNYELEADGTKNRRDLPAVINTGVTYRITDKLIAGADFNYYFQTSANWGDVMDPTTGNTEKASKAAGNCYTANLGFRYLLSEKLELSAGCSYTAFMYDDMELYYTKMGLYEALKYNNFNVGLGVGYSITNNIQLDLGFGRTFWQDKTINSLSGKAFTSTDFPVKVTDSGYVAAVGFDFKF